MTITDKTIEAACDAYNNWCDENEHTLERYCHDVPMRRAIQALLNSGEIEIGELKNDT